ncbi:MAG: ABC transporter permease subunit [Candidatus Paracaedibacteraceae bacterium]|nr:ABC transporter permease subunit [Candidatus Paracaedibacteraceae bacterium]
MFKSFVTTWQQNQSRLETLYAGRHKLVLLLPYVWLLIFFFVPFLIILKISFSKATIGIPPFMPVFEWLQDYQFRISLHLSNYKSLIDDSFYLSTFMSSLWMASLSTFICLLLGYMMAYGIIRSKPRLRMIFLLLIILPFWTSFLIRVYAWMSLLSAQGIINSMLMHIGFIAEPLALLDNRYAVCIGIVYCYLPFMVLPIYAALEKIDQSYIEAAFDLGCTPWGTFWRITVPLTMPGIAAGCILVFVPSVGEFVIPELLGGPDTLMIGRALWCEFFNNRDWPQASALAVSMVFIFVLPIMFFQWQQQKIEKGL